MKVNHLYAMRDNKRSFVFVESPKILLALLLTIFIFGMPTTNAQVLKTCIIGNAGNHNDVQLLDMWTTQVHHRGMIRGRSRGIPDHEDCLNPFFIGNYIGMAYSHFEVKDMRLKRNIIFEEPVGPIDVERNEHVWAKFSNIKRINGMFYTSRGSDIWDRREACTYGFSYTFSVHSDIYGIKFSKDSVFTLPTRETVPNRYSGELAVQCRPYKS